MTAAAGPVVHVVVAGEIGGAERMLLDLARPTDGGRPHSIALFTPNPALRTLFERGGLDIDDRGPVKEGPLRFLASSLGRDDVRWLEGVLARRGARIVHLHTFASQVLGTRAAEEAGARIVRTDHSTRAYDDPTCWPVRIIADKGYDSDDLRAAFASVDIQLLAPHRSNRTKQKRSNDGRCMRRYRRRWIVERFFAWLNGFRRLIVRHERHSLMYRAFVHVACVLVSMRAL